MRNKTDGYYVKAVLDEAAGVYYVTDHVDKKAEATRFVPVETADSKGKVIVKGLEDDEYVIEETKTADGYGDAASGFASEAIALAGTILSVLPLLFFYIIFQRQFVESIESSGITGE